MEAVELDELDALAAALEDPSGCDLGAALERVATMAERHLEGDAPGSIHFMERMVELLKRVRGVEHPDPRLKAMFTALVYFYFMGRPLGGSDLGTDTIDLARRTGHPMLRKALTMQGGVFADSANVPRAIECYAEALDIARAQGDVAGEGTAWMNLGVSLVYSGQAREAMACFEHILHMSGSREVPENLLASVWSNIAFCCLHTGDTGRGLRAIETALRGLGELKTRGRGWFRSGTIEVRVGTPVHLSLIHISEPTRPY